jgi:hypothetical protein
MRKMHIYNLSSQGGWSKRIKNSRVDWATWQVWDQPGLNKEICHKKSLKKEGKINFSNILFDTEYLKYSHSNM